MNANYCWLVICGKWRKGWVMRPFCHVLIKVTRWDSPPWRLGSVPFHKLLNQWRLESKLSQEGAAARLGVSLSTYQNWEHGRSKPTRMSWPRLKPVVMLPTASETNKPQRDATSQ